MNTLGTRYFQQNPYLKCLEFFSGVLTYICMQLPDVGAMVAYTDMQLQLWHHVSRSNRLPSIAALLQQYGRNNGLRHQACLHKKIRELMSNLKQWLWYNFLFWRTWHLKDQNKVYILKKRYFFQNTEFNRCLIFFSGVLTDIYATSRRRGYGCLCGTCNCNYDTMWADLID